MCSSGDRDGVELSKFSKGSERISTGSIQSAGSCACTNAPLIVKVLIATILNSRLHHLSSEKDSEFSPTAALRDCVPEANPGEEDQVPRAGRDGSYLDSELLNGRDADSQSCSSKADEALKTCKTAFELHYLTNASLSYHVLFLTNNECEIIIFINYACQAS